MTIYRLWVLSLNGQRLIYSRYFPHLEKQDNFTFPSISANEFLRSVFASLGLDYANSIPASSTSTLSNVDYDYGKLSRSSSSASSSSLNSLISTSTSLSNRTKGPDGATVADSSISSGFSVFHNYLPLIVCRFMNNPRDNMSLAMGEHHHHPKTPYIDLILLVFEKNGHLFICCPRLVSHLSTINIDNNYEQLLLEEQNISLSYSALQLISSSFFTHNKSVKQLEIFVSNCMPFGTLINDGLRLKQSLLTLEKKADKLSPSLYPLLFKPFLETLQALISTQSRLYLAHLLSNVRL